jgi:hypothetical protein
MGDGGEVRRVVVYTDSVGPERAVLSLCRQVDGSGEDGETVIVGILELEHPQYVSEFLGGSGGAVSVGATFRYWPELLWDSLRGDGFLLAGE